MQKKIEIISQYQQLLLTLPEKIDNSMIKGVELSNIWAYPRVDFITKSTEIVLGF